jgi:hypothetical protein
MLSLLGTEMSYLFFLKLFSTYFIQFNFENNFFFFFFLTTKTYYEKCSTLFVFHNFLNSLISCLGQLKNNIFLALITYLWRYLLIKKNSLKRLFDQWKADNL